MSHSGCKWTLWSSERRQELGHLWALTQDTYQELVSSTLGREVLE